jgi:thioredoxin-dependent peroxiredoxin
MATLKAGDTAPDFSFTDLNGQQKNLKDYRGRNVVIYFYPKDNTPGCTAEACSLRDHYETFREKGFEIIGVSADSEKSHEGFRNKYQLPFELISDKEKQIIQLYGAWGEKKMMGRAYMGILRQTFVIDPEGRIGAIIDKVDTKNHAQQLFGEIKI